MVLKLKPYARNAVPDHVDTMGLDPQFSLHDILMQRGEAGAAAASLVTDRVRGRRSTADVLAARRGRRIIKAAAEHLDDKSQAARQQDPAEEARAFVYSAWCHASFPHKSPTTLDEPWTVQTSLVTLRVEPGKTEDGTVFGLPYGAYARLLCIDWSSQAYHNRSRDIELGRNLTQTMRRLGLDVGGGKTRNLILNQAERLARCRLTFYFREQGQEKGFINQTIVDRATFSQSAWNSRFVESIRLSESFYEQLLAYPVAIDPMSIVAIRNSPMAIDIYCWLAYRLLAVEEPTEISWTALKAQFGNGYATPRFFKAQFTESLALAKSVYIGARADLTPHGIVLSRSPPPTTPAKPIRSKAAARLL